MRLFFFLKIHATSPVSQYQVFFFCNDTNTGFVIYQLSPIIFLLHVRCIHPFPLSPFRVTVFYDGDPTVITEYVKFIGNQTGMRVCFRSTDDRFSLPTVRPRGLPILTFWPPDLV